MEPISREDIVMGLEEIVAARGQGLGWTNNERAMDRFVRNVQDKRCTKESYMDSIERVILDFKTKEFGPKPPAVLNRIDDSPSVTATRENGCELCHNGFRTLFKLSEDGLHEDTLTTWCSCSKALDQDIFDKGAYMKMTEVTVLMQKYPERYMFKGSNPDKLAEIMHQTIMARGNNHNMARKLEGLLEGNYLEAISFIDTYDPEKPDKVPF